MQNLFMNSLFSQLGQYLPGLILDVVGIAFSIYSYRKNTRKFLLTTISFSVFFLNSLAGLFSNAWTMTQLAEQKFSATQAVFSFRFFNYCVTTPIWLAAWVILFIVLFSNKYNSVEMDHGQHVDVTKNLNGEQ